MIICIYLKHSENTPASDKADLKSFLYFGIKMQYPLNAQLYGLISEQILSNNVYEKQNYTNNIAYIVHDIGYITTIYSSLMIFYICEE